MKLRICLVALGLLFLTACGTPVEGGLLFRTADPALSLFVPVAQPEVVPAEEVGEVVPEPEPTPPCLAIKGNINSAGEKIYHMPDGAYYAQVKIDEAAGEAFFCSEEEAQAAGFRKALR